MPSWNLFDALAIDWIVRIHSAKIWTFVTLDSAWTSFFECLDRFSVVSPPSTDSDSEYPWPATCYHQSIEHASNFQYFWNSNFNNNASRETSSSLVVRDAEEQLNRLAHQDPLLGKAVHSHSQASQRCIHPRAPQSCHLHHPEELQEKDRARPATEVYWTNCSAAAGLVAALHHQNLQEAPCWAFGARVPARPDCLCGSAMQRHYSVFLRSL